MIIKDIKIFLQNVWKNNLIINKILKTKFNFNIIFIQKLSWATICSIHSMRNCEGEELVGVQNHPNWLTFVRNPINKNNISSFLFKRISLIIKIFFWYFFLSTMTFSFWWMLWLVISIFRTIYRILYFYITLLSVTISLLLQISLI